MTWYAAHVVQQVRFIRQRRRRQVVFENILLIKARDGDHAWKQAESLGTCSDGPFAWKGEPAIWEFVGVRKVVETLCAGSTPAHGDELTYNELYLDSPIEVRRFAEGSSAHATHRDEYHQRVVRRTRRANKRIPKSRARVKANR
jgi:hypothetical protein